MSSLLKLVLWLYVVLKSGFTQQCMFNHTIQSNGLAAININIQDQPACFICPNIAESFSLNNEPIMDATSGVVIKNSTLIIPTWSAVSLVTDTANRLACTATENNTEYATFFSVIRECIILESNKTVSIHVNISNTPTCFSCPQSASSFMLNDNPLMNNPPDVVINSTTVVIYNWTTVHVSLSGANMISCIHKDDKLPSQITFHFLTTNQYHTVTTNSMISTVVNPWRATLAVPSLVPKRSDFDSTIVIAIVVSLLSIILISIIIVVVLVLLFRKKAKMEHISMTKTNSSFKRSNISESYNSSPQHSIIGACVMVDPNQTQESQYRKEMDAFDSCNKLESGQNKISAVDSSGLYSTVDKDFMEPGYEEDIPDLYSVVGSAKGKETDISSKVPNFYSEIDMSKENVKSDNPASIGELYAVVDKSKKNSKKHDEVSPDNVSAMYAIVDKTKKKKAEGENETDPNVLELYAVIDKSKKIKKEKCDEHTPDLSEMYAVVDKSKKANANPDFFPDESGMYAVVDKETKKR